MRRKIASVIDEMINPHVASHGGRIELVDYIDGNVYLEMTGGCQGCAQSMVTLRQGVQSLLEEEFGDSINEIIDTTDHSGGDNPYFSGAK